MSSAPTVKHDAQNPDNCPPKCRGCAKATKDAHRGGRSTVVAAPPATKPSWWSCSLACGHIVEVQKSGHHPPTVAHCSDPKCSGRLVAK